MKRYLPGDLICWQRHNIAVFYLYDNIEIYFGDIKIFIVRDDYESYFYDVSNVKQPVDVVLA